MATGAGLVILPLVLRATSFGRGFSAIIPLGILMFAAGAGLLWWSLRKARAGGSSAQRTAADFTGAAQSGAPAHPGEDKVFAEFERVAINEESTQGRPSVPPEAWGPDAFAAIEWRRFEAVVEALFQQAGLETKSQSHGADGGVDIWLYTQSQPDQPVCIVQCKHWSAKSIGVDKIRELLGVMTAKRVPRGVFATTSMFSSDAKEFAQGNNIDLLDVDRLLAMIAKRTPVQQQDLLAVALDGEYWKPTCVNCGIKMVERKSGKDGSPFWGCANFPRCRTTMQMRAI